MLKRNHTASTVLEFSIFSYNLIVLFIYLFLNLACLLSLLSGIAEAEIYTGKISMLFFPQCFELHVHLHLILQSMNVKYCQAMSLTKL